MAQAAKYVTRQEFESVKTELERLSIRVAVLSQDQHSLTNQVADLAEDMNARFDTLTDGVNGLSAQFATLTEDVNGLNGQFAELRKLIADGHAALISAVMKLGKR